jgi:hypothetical protein
MHKHACPQILAPLVIVLTALALANPASADTLSLMWAPSTGPEIAGYIVHMGTQPGTYTQRVDVGLTTTWSHMSATAGQQYCFVVSAYVDGPIEGPRSNEVCGFSNAPPVLVYPGAQRSIVGQATSLQLDGSDAQNEPLTYSATGLPPGLTLMASTGYIAGTPTTAGTYSVTARASDGVLTASRTFTWTVGTADTTANQPPTLASIANQSSRVGLQTTLQLAGSDSNVDQLTYFAQGLPNGLSVASSTGLISGTPTTTGVFNVTAMVSDGSLTAARTFTWTISAAADATVPVVTIQGPTTSTSFTTTTGTVTLSGTARDNVGVTRVTWSNNRGGSGTASGTMSWRATGIALQPGTNVLTVRARDAAGNASTDVLTVTFNEPLRVASLTANRTAPQRLGTTVTFTAVGAGGTGPYEYLWRVYDGSAWVTLATWSSSNRFVWTPTLPITYQVRAVVRSATGATATATMEYSIVQ